jgi:hypothetical protein
MHNFQRAAARRQYNFLRNNIHHRMKHGKIQRFEKVIEDASTINNNIWENNKTIHQASVSMSHSSK